MSYNHKKGGRAQFCKDFVLSHPNAFLLLASLYFQTIEKNTESNQIHFRFHDLKTCGYPNVLTPKKYRTALKVLERMELIKIEKSKLRGYVFITILINPFFTTETKVFPCQD